MTKLRQYLRNLIKLGLLLSIIFCFSSCQRNTEPTETQENPERVFLKSFKETIKFDIPLYLNTRLVGNTLWIYIATDKEILTLERSPQSYNKETGYLRLKGDYSQDGFKFYYAIEKIKTFPETRYKEEPAASGITESYTITTQEIINKTYSSISDTIRHARGQLKFFIICIADINKGIEIRLTVNQTDIEKFISGALHAEEFYSRAILKEVGSEKIVGDKKGRHLDYAEVNMSDFIIELTSVQARQDFSKLKEEEKDNIKAENIVLKNLFKYTRIYEFEAFSLIQLQDILSDKQNILLKIELLERFKDLEV